MGSSLLGRYLKAPRHPRASSMVSRHLVAALTIHMPPGMPQLSSPVGRYAVSSTTTSLLYYLTPSPAACHHTHTPHTTVRATAAHLLLADTRIRGRCWGDCAMAEWDVAGHTTSAVCGREPPPRLFCYNSPSTLRHCRLHSFNTSFAGARAHLQVAASSFLTALWCGCLAAGGCLAAHSPVGKRGYAQRRSPRRSPLAATLPTHLVNRFHRLHWFGRKRDVVPPWAGSLDRGTCLCPPRCPPPVNYHNYQRFLQKHTVDDFSLRIFSRTCGLQHHMLKQDSAGRKKKKKKGQPRPHAVPLHTALTRAAFPPSRQHTLPLPQFSTLLPLGQDRTSLNILYSVPTPSSLLKILLSLFFSQHCAIQFNTLTTKAGVPFLLKPTNTAPASLTSSAACLPRSPAHCPNRTTLPPRCELPGLAARRGIAFARGGRHLGDRLFSLPFAGGGLAWLA